jgi:hypothetical protein
VLEDDKVGTQDQAGLAPKLLLLTSALHCLPKFIAGLIFHNALFMKIDLPRIRRNLICNYTQNFLCISLKDPNFLVYARSLNPYKHMWDNQCWR